MSHASEGNSLLPVDATDVPARRFDPRETNRDHFNQERVIALLTAMHAQLVQIEFNTRPGPTGPFFPSGAPVMFPSGPGYIGGSATAGTC